MPNIGERVLVSFMPFAKSSVIHFTWAPTMPLFFGKFEPRGYDERCSDGGQDFANFLCMIASLFRFSTVCVWFAARFVSRYHRGTVRL